MLKNVFLVVGIHKYIGYRTAFHFYQTLGIDNLSKKDTDL